MRNFLIFLFNIISPIPDVKSNRERIKCVCFFFHHNRNERYKNPHQWYRNDTVLVGIKQHKVAITSRLVTVNKTTLIEIRVVAVSAAYRCRLYKSYNHRKWDVILEVLWIHVNCNNVKNKRGKVMYSLVFRGRDGKENNNNWKILGKIWKAKVTNRILWYL